MLKLVHYSLPLGVSLSAPPPDEFPLGLVLQEELYWGLLGGELDIGLRGGHVRNRYGMGFMGRGQWVTCGLGVGWASDGGVGQRVEPDDVELTGWYHLVVSPFAHRDDRVQSALSVWRNQDGHSEWTLGVRLYGPAPATALGLQAQVTAVNGEVIFEMALFGRGALAPVEELSRILNKT